MNPYRLCLAAIMAVAVVPGGMATAAKMYKWVDDQGRVHYSDSVPPDEVQRRREREVKSESGQTVEKVVPPPTREELEARERVRREAEEERRGQAEAEARRAEHDRMLLMTYQNVAAMETARDDRIEAIEAQIRLIEGRIAKIESDLDRHRREAARRERSSRGDPGPVYEEIAALEGSIRDNLRFIEGKRAEQRRIREEFARDIERFRTLKAGQAQR